MSEINRSTKTGENAFAVCRRAAASFNQRIEPMRGSAVRLAPYAGTCGALPLMAHPQRSATMAESTRTYMMI
jgi:hypothetical protein